MELKGKVALITGGASGLGLATVEHLCAQGVSVVSMDKMLPSSNATHSVAHKVLNLTADVRNEFDVTAAISKAIAAYGALHILVNCAGVGTAKRVLGKDGPAPLSSFQEVIDINLIGTFNVMRLAAQKMALNQEAEENGVIINTASIAAFDGQIGQCAYSASKSAIVGMTLPAARELAKFGIRVMAIAPGLMSTPLLHHLPEEIQSSLKSQVTFPKRFGHPSEYAKLVADIITNPMLNAEVIRLDGGLRMQAT